MTEAPYPTRKRGVAGIVFVLSVLVGAGGFALEWTHKTEPFWIGAAAGGRAVIAGAAVIVALLAAHVLRLLLSRRIEQEGRDAGD